MQTTEASSSVRVALIIEGGRIRPVWFEETDRPGRDRVYVRQVCSVWWHMEGAAKIINFDVWDGANSYRLALNTREFTWRLAIAEESAYPRQAVPY